MFGISFIVAAPDFEVVVPVRWQHQTLSVGVTVGIVVAIQACLSTPLADLDRGGTHTVLAAVCVRIAGESQFGFVSPGAEHLRGHWGSRVYGAQGWLEREAGLSPLDVDFLYIGTYALLKSRQAGTTAEGVGCAVRKDL
jgi:hypothetical protein